MSEKLPDHGRFFVPSFQVTKISARLRDDAPEPDSVPLEINAAYPAGLPFPTSPFPLLAALPPLSTGLANRVIGRDLILLDQPADLLIDYMRNALPPRAATPSPPSSATPHNEGQGSQHSTL